MNEEQAVDDSAVRALKVPLLVDLGVIVSIIFGGGIMWNKVDALAMQVAEIRQPAASDRDRLARIEERLIGLQSQMVELKQEVRR